MFPQLKKEYQENNCLYMVLQNGNSRTHLNNCHRPQVSYLFN